MFAAGSKMALRMNGTGQSPLKQFMNYQQWFSPRLFAGYVALVLSGLVLWLSSGCAHHPPVLPPQVATLLAPVAKASIMDGRARFREIYCAVKQAEIRHANVICDSERELWRLPDEAEPSGQPISWITTHKPWHVVIVPGLLAECVKDASLVFADSMARLRSLGFATSYIQTRGRLGSETNAEIIRQAILRLPAEDRLILVTHSKGTIDSLVSLVRHPELAERVVALISVAGAVNGSPLTSELPDVLEDLAEKIPMASCPRGREQEAANSLLRSERLHWLATHNLPVGVRFYSLAAFTDSAHISMILKPFHALLTELDPANDGLLIASDTIIPGSTLLGYPNADHLAVAMPFVRERFWLTPELVNQNRFPRARLLEAALRFVEQDLAQAVETKTPDFAQGNGARY